MRDYGPPEWAKGKGNSGSSNTNQAPGSRDNSRARQEQKAEQARQQLINEAHSANSQGVEFFNKQDWASAVPFFEEAARKNPDDPIIRQNLARAKSALEAQLAQEQAKQQDKKAAANMQQAINSFAQTLQTRPDVAGSVDFDGRNAKSPSGGGLDFISTTPAAGAAKPTTATLEFGDPMVVDLRGTTKTAIDPSVLKAGGEHPATGRDVEARAVQASAPPPQVLSKTDSLARVRQQIQVTQETLRRLNDSMKLDPAQREEWINESSKASRDAWFTAGDLTLGILGERLDQQINEASQAIKPGLDPATLAALTQRREDLLTAKKAVDGAGQALSNASALKDVGEKFDPIQTAYDTCDKLNVFPGWAKQAKIALDATYEATVQAYSVQRLGALNAHSEQYLAAVGVLGKKMEALVELEKTLKAGPNQPTDGNP